MENVTKQHRSKYGFGTHKVGDEILVEPLDVHSMLSALYAFNKRHDRDIKVEASTSTREGKVVCLVTQI